MFYVKGHHEAIIDEKDFDKVQEKMKEREDLKPKF